MYRLNATIPVGYKTKVGLEKQTHVAIQPPQKAETALTQAAMESTDKVLGKGDSCFQG